MSDLYRQYLEEAQAGMKESAELINTLTAARTRQVPESHFAKYLLPIIRQWVTRQGDPEIGYWLNVCDGLNREFHVFKDDDADKNILFTVPPPFVDIDLATSLPPGFSLHDRYNNLAHVVNRQGYAADNGDTRQFWDMEHQIVEANHAKPAKESMERALAQLVVIWRYYSLPVSELLGEEGAAQLGDAGMTSGTTTSSSQSGGISDDPDAYDF